MRVELEGVGTGCGDFTEEFNRVAKGPKIELVGSSGWYVEW
jgi:hypothetical protein